MHNGKCGDGVGRYGAGSGTGGGMAGEGTGSGRSDNNTTGCRHLGVATN